MKMVINVLKVTTVFNNSATQTYKATYISSHRLYRVFYGYYETLMEIKTVLEPLI